MIARFGETVKLGNTTLTPTPGFGQAALLRGIESVPVKVEKAEAWANAWASYFGRDS